MSLNPVDPKWLEILKASGWQTSALAVACTLILILIKYGVIPATANPLWIAIPSIGAIIFWCLSLASLGSALIKYFKPAEKLAFRKIIRQKEKEVREFIPHMTDRDKKIIGYLLHHNQKMFDADQDAGYAAALTSRGIVRVACKHGQVYDPSSMPFEVPDYVWSVLVENQEKFPYQPPPEGENELHPWRVPWMLR